ncbi:ABC transporter permease [Pyrococcus yayanosii]|uniref:ABC transporter n=1 Tax=Pyrococcus yayanosii (strain CH1 / JCM 16557) TaxID=529709 RepID=F8AH41_PYRYC|nr:ABC transporter permease [Pyrococcus yayanosii]AEH24104.1 ABC transporter [Pyrococcus yayanosii CH1]
MSDFWVIFMKELKHMLRDRGLIFGIIIVPLILYPALGQVVQLGMEQAQEETKVVIANFDEGPYGALLIKALIAAPNVTVVQINASSVDEALQEAINGDQNVLVIIPANFSESIEANEKAVVEVYGIFGGMSLGMRESVSEGRINAVVNVLGEELSKLKLKNFGNPEAVLHPIEVRGYSVLRGKIIDMPPSVVANVLASQAFSIPLVIFIMLTLVSQMAAGTMASEKENKTLETLLTLPVSRTAIVAGKMMGTGVMGLIAAIAYMIGMKRYLGTFSQSNISLEELGLHVTPLGMALFALTIFLAITFALSLAMLLGIFAEDIRSAGTLVSAVMMPLLFPTFIFMVTDVEALPAIIKYALLAIPFSHPVLASRAMLLGDYGHLYVSVAYLAFVSAAMLYVTARFFRTEKLLTARLKFGKKKR